MASPRKTKNITKSNPIPAKTRPIIGNALSATRSRKIAPSTAETQALPSPQITYVFSTSLAYIEIPYVRCCLDARIVDMN